MENKKVEITLALYMTVLICTALLTACAGLSAEPLPPNAPG